MRDNWCCIGWVLFIISLGILLGLIVAGVVLFRGFRCYYFDRLMFVINVGWVLLCVCLLRALRL